MQVLTEVLAIFDKSIECQASFEVGVQVGVSVRNISTKVAPKSIEKGIVRICSIMVFWSNLIRFLWTSVAIYKAEHWIFMFWPCI